MGRKKARLHRKGRARTRRRPAGFRRRQTGQRPRNSFRLSRGRRCCLSPVQRTQRRHALVLPYAGQCIPQSWLKRADRRTRPRRHRTRTSRQVGAQPAAAGDPATQNVNRKLAETLRGGATDVPENKLAKLITLTRSVKFAPSTCKVALRCSLL